MLCHAHGVRVVERLRREMSSVLSEVRRRPRVNDLFRIEEMRSARMQEVMRRPMLRIC